jgi:ABC-type branched-subunit amino acid transport system ATPase component
MDRLLIECYFLPTVQAYPYHKSFAVLAEQPVLVRFRGLQKSFGGQTVLNSISGEIRHGEVILLRGENGSGKTTLLNILTGCLEPDCGTIEFCPHGEYKEEAFRFPRAWHQELNPFKHFSPERVSRLGVGRTWQDVRLFRSLDLADNIATASTESNDSPWAALFRHRHNHEMSQKNRLTASNKLEALGLIGRNESSADKISLGQSKRVAIARALQANARILFLDEPMAGLDANGIKDVIEQLTTLVVNRLLTLVIVEHVTNWAVLKPLVTNEWTIINGSIHKNLPHETDVSNSVGQLLVPVTKSKPTQTKVTPKVKQTSYRQIGATDQNEGLHVERLCVSRKDRLVLSNWCLRLDIGTISLLEADNGSGKTTLIEALAGIVTSASGTIYLNGVALGNSPVWTRTTKFGVRMVSSGPGLFDSLTISECVRLCRINTTSSASHGNRRIDALSGGERRMLCLSLIPSEGSLYIYDEPFQALDSLRIQEAVRIILAHKAPMTLITSPTAPSQD